MSRRALNRHHAARKEARYGAVIVQCVVMYLMCFFPAMTFGPILPVGMAALMTLLVTAKLKSISQGIRRGLLLGLLAGLAIYGGFRYAIQGRRMEMAAAERSHCLAGGIWQAGAAVSGSLVEGVGVAGVGRAVALGGEVPAIDPETCKDADMTKWRLSAEQQQAIAQERVVLDGYDRVLLVVTIPPALVICTLVGLVATWRAQQRKQAIDNLWQRDLQKQS
jgi:hypothetical protein